MGLFVWPRVTMHFSTECTARAFLFLKPLLIEEKTLQNAASPYWTKNCPWLKLPKSLELPFACQIKNKILQYFFSAAQRKRDKSKPTPMSSQSAAGVMSFHPWQSRPWVKKQFCPWIPPRLCCPSLRDLNIKRYFPPQPPATNRGDWREYLAGFFENPGPLHLNSFGRREEVKRELTGNLLKQV